MLAPGSASSIQRVIADISGLAIGDWLPVVRSVKSIRRSPESSPSTSAIRSRAASSPSPGGTRQSIRS